MNKRMRVLLLAILPLALLASVPAQAAHGQRHHGQHADRGHYPSRQQRDDRHRQQPDRRQRRTQPGMSASQAADMARSRAGGGRVLSVHQRGGGYQVKLLKHDGTVHVVNVGGD